MRKKKPWTAAEQSIRYEVDAEPITEKITCLAGIPLLLETSRALGLPESVKRHVRIKERERGLNEASMVEGFLVLNAAGGECVDDFDHLRQDQGLAELIGHEMPSASAARRFLKGFHSEEQIEEAKQMRLPDEVAYIPGENDQLAGLGWVNRELIIAFGKRVANEKIATVDQDATIIESHKREALRAYTGERGYQPMLAVWAETGIILADEFRDGNVPAMMEPLTVAKIAFSSLPASVSTFYYRGDSACHEHELIKWLQDEQRPDGPSGPIGFAISARMSRALREAIIAGISEDKWESYGEADRDTIQECADVVFVSNEEAQNRHSQPLRYIAIRLRKRQGELFADGSTVRYFAIVSNLWEWGAVKLVKWQRGKAGTIELVHDILKNDYATGVLPSRWFGANAAWLRLAVITHNLVTALKRLALPADLLDARPKRLRFLIFNTAGRIVHHARKIILRLATTADRIAQYWHEPLRLLIA
jgi:hypothetical protein